MSLDLRQDEVDSIKKVFHEFHKTRLTHKFSIDPEDLCKLLDVCLLATGQKRVYHK